jgi:hypothetical protein
MKCETRETLLSQREHVGIEVKPFVGIVITEIGGVRGGAASDIEQCTSAWNPLALGEEFLEAARLCGIVLPGIDGVVELGRVHEHLGGSFQSADITMMSDRSPPSWIKPKHPGNALAAVL